MGLLALSIATAATCYKSPMQPTGAPGPSGATVTIKGSGVQPGSVTVAVGQSVTFVNADGTAHDIQPTPGQPVDCVQIGAVAMVPAGQSKLTNAFSMPETCSFYDYGAPGDQKFQGTITVQ